MNTSETERPEQGTSPSMHVIEVTVNFKPVSMPHDHATGLEIKEAAIRQGVNIQLDFILFLDKGHGKRERVRDEERIELHRGEAFEAVPGDDNS